MSYSQYFLIVFLVSNSIVYLTAQRYTAIPQQGTILKAGLRRSFELRCVYSGDDGEFAGWFKQNATHNVSVNTDKPGHYIVKQNKHESNLTIKIFVVADANVTRWYVKTKKETTSTPCEFGHISIIPSPQGIQDNKDLLIDGPHESIRRTEDQKLELDCLIEPTNENEKHSVQWEFSPDDKVYEPLDNTITPEGDKIKFDAVKKFHRGYYRCKLNGFDFTVLLRVKDKLAALWPFIGIVSIVLILVIIILIFEKRQKSNKKPTSNDDDDQDRASDPLVRTTTKASDNDNKKRAVKA